MIKYLVLFLYLSEKLLTKMYSFIYKVMFKMLDEWVEMDKLCLRGVFLYSEVKLVKIEIL